MATSNKMTNSGNRRFLVIATLFTISLISFLYWANQSNTPLVSSDHTKPSSNPTKISKTSIETICPSLMGGRSARLIEGLKANYRVRLVSQPDDLIAEITISDIFGSCHVYVEQGMIIGRFYVPAQQKAIKSIASSTIH